MNMPPFAPFRSLFVPLLCGLATVFLLAAGQAGAEEVATIEANAEEILGKLVPDLVASSEGLLKILNIDPSMMTGSFIGVIGASFIYLLATSVVIRDRTQTYLVFMLLCMLIGVMAENGIFDGIQGNAVLTQFAHVSSVLLFYATSCVFAEQYLEFDVRKSFYRLVLKAISILAVSGFILAAFDIAFISKYLNWISLFALTALVLGGFISYFTKVYGSLAFILAFSAIFLGQIISVLDECDLIEAPLSTREITGLSFATCAMLFAVVIAAQFARRQEKKEFELARSNERFQMAALGSNEGLYDWDFFKRDGYFSNRLNRIFGINLGATKENILQRWLSIVHPEDRKMVRRALFAFLRDRDKNTLTIEYRIKRLDGKISWVTSAAVAVRNQFTGKPTRLVGSVGDITEKKRAEFRLRASEKRFRSIAEAHPVPVLIATVDDGEIVYATHGTEATLHTSLSKLLGISLSLFFEKGEDCRSILDDVRRDGQVDLRETIVRRADQSRFPAAISARLIDYERRQCAVLGIYDLSERKTAEARIKETEAALLQSEKLAALGGLLAGVAHELNNPLSVIVGQAVLVREGAKDDKTSQRADKIQKAGERCSRIVRSFLALARRKTTERKATSINQIIENSLELIAFQLRTDNVELERKMSETLPAAYADADQMTQVITNLVINAKHALQEHVGPRRVTVETRYEADGAEEGGLIYVSVTDNGTGVPKEIMHRIFEPFFTTKAAGSGTGVGLSLCHSIVESHGGRIWVEDAPEGGARFIFTIPANTLIMAEENLNAMTTGANLRVPPQRLLIIDDEVELAQTLADILAPDGHTITIVHNGKVALERLAREEYDVIISDLRMPVLDGPGLYRELEKVKSRYLSRIIFVTGDTLSTSVSDFLSAYGLDVIEKPYTPDEVRRAIVYLVKDLKRKRKTAGSTSTDPAPPPVQG
jgi:PAS domain S-box-containing protein